MSGCDVCIGGWDGDSPDFFHEFIHKARKSHNCYECGREIPSGEVYHGVTGRWEGEISTYKFCWFCWEVHHVFSCGEGMMFGVLWESMQDYAFPKLTTASPCFRDLSPDAKKMLLSKWQEWKGLTQ